MAGTGVGKFSSTASNNTSNLTVNFAENMAPSNVNNAARELMGHMRDMYEQLGDGYFEFGDGDGEYTVTRGDADTITITGTGDITSVYYVGRKIRITDGGGNVVEGVISASSHSSTTQTIDLTGITLASGAPTKVELGIDTAAFGGKVILDDDGDTYIEAPTDDTIDIYVAGAKDFVITANTFNVLTGSSVSLADECVLNIGTGNDLQISHDGNSSYIKDTGTGGLIIQSNSLQFKNADGGENVFLGTEDGAVTLYHDNAVKLATTATGIDVTGAITATAASTITVANNSDNLSLISTDADGSSGPNLRMYRNSGSPADGDDLGVIDFEGRNDASQDVVYAQIKSLVTDQTDGTEDGKLEFYHMLGGSLAPSLQLTSTEVVINESSNDIDFRVESNGNQNMLYVDGGADFVGIGTSDQNSSVCNIAGATAGNPILTVDSTSASYSGNVQRIYATRANTDAYGFLQIFSGAGSDVEFLLRGDGNAYADNNWNAGGADYAEYFEWKDGNSSSEDRRGYSVVLDGNQIVKATDSDDVSKIIGIISATPCIVGDGAWNKWSDKYQKDDFGSYLRDEDGHRILNTDYDETKDYVPRENRKEWDTVGLMGKLRLRKGQPTGTNWLKMRDISDTVEEWLIR